MGCVTHADDGAPDGGGVAADDNWAVNPASTVTPAAAVTRTTKMRDSNLSAVDPTR